MDRRAFLKHLGLGAAALGLPRALRAASRKTRRPNVLLIFTDDQGTLDVGCFGSTDLYTPHMDALARRGVRFTQAYAHTVCCPARAMLMTGRHPQRANVNSWQQGNAKGPKGLNMFLSEITLAEVLRAAGYRTALFGKWHLGAHFDHGQGFDEFFGIRDGFIDNYNHFFLHGKGYHDLYRGTDEVFRRGEYFPDLAVDETLRFLDANKGRPWFVYLAFNIPHYPEQADAKFDERYEGLPEPRRSYAKIVSTTDDRMGRVLAKLDDLGLRDDTLILFMSDNGYSAEDYRIRADGHASGLPKGHRYGANGGGGNTGKWRGHKGTFFEGGIRVPAIISFPGRIPEGEVRGQAVTAMDVLPTVCGARGPQSAAAAQGAPLAVAAQLGRPRGRLEAHRHGPRQEATPLSRQPRRPPAGAEELRHRQARPRQAARRAARRLGEGRGPRGRRAMTRTGATPTPTRPDAPASGRRCPRSSVVERSKGLLRLVTLEHRDEWWWGEHGDE